jgi:hypothetical protein
MVFLSTQSAKSEFEQRSGLNTRRRTDRETERGRVIDKETKDISTCTTDVHSH